VLGAWAVILLVNGDRTKDINVLQDYERTFVVIVTLYIRTRSTNKERIQ
jgi:hypothetical protein